MIKTISDMGNAAVKPYLTSIDDHFIEQYGPKGTTERDQFDQEARAFMIAEML